MFIAAVLELGVQPCPEGQVLAGRNGCGSKPAPKRAVANFELLATVGSINDPFAVGATHVAPGDLF